jgi:hypothetical protein
MAKQNINLKDIEKLIDGRKKEMIEQSNALGEATNVTLGAAADNELHELVNALQTKNPNTPVVNKIRVVEHRSKNIDVKTRTNMNPPLDENTLKHITSAKPQTNKTPLIHENIGVAGGMKNDLASQERNINFNQYNNRGVGAPNTGGIYDVASQYNKSGVMNEYNTGMVTPNTGGNQMMGVNAQALNEQIGNHTVAFINEHFVNLADLALKNHIVETYAVDRVRKVLEEQMKPVIEKMVKDTIREIQNKNKKKTAK